MNLEQKKKYLLLLSDDEFIKKLIDCFTVTYEVLLLFSFPYSFSYQVKYIDFLTIGLI